MIRAKKWHVEYHDVNKGTFYVVSMARNSPHDHFLFLGSRQSESIFIDFVVYCLCG